MDDLDLAGVGEDPPDQFGTGNGGEGEAQSAIREPFALLAGEPLALGEEPGFAGVAEDRHVGDGGVVEDVARTDLGQSGGVAAEDGIQGQASRMRCRARLRQPWRRWQ